MSERNDVLQAVLLSTTPPTGEQERRFCELLRARYGREIALTWKESEDYPHGFRLMVGEDLFDWSVDGRLRQLRKAVEKSGKGSWYQGYSFYENRPRKRGDAVC